MLNLSKTGLFLFSILLFCISQVTAANGTCEIITSKLCPDFPNIHAKITQESFDTKVQDKYEELKRKLTNDNNSCDADFATKVRFLKSLACTIIIKDQSCSSNVSLCPDMCTYLTSSLEGITCVDIEGKSSIDSQCSAKTVQSSNCLSYYELELGTCGFEDASVKASFCAKPENSDTKCCKSNAPAPEKVVISAAEKDETKPKEHVQVEEEKKKKGGSFFTSKVFIVLLILIILIIAVLGYFYYVGSKDEKEERMRNMEMGNHGGYMESYYQGGNDSKSRDVSSGYNYGNEDYNLSGNNYNYHKKSEDENPFDDSNRIDTYSRRISNRIYGDDNDDDNEYSKKAFNPFEQSYNDVQNSALLAAPPDVHNPFDSPKFEEDSIINNFPMPVSNNADKLKKEDTKNNSTAPTTKLETTYIPAIVLTDEKDINIGDDVLKPSVVTLTEIKTPEENNIKDEKEVETPKEPQKGMVNMIDIKKPSSNEVVKTNNGLTPSILITNENGDVSSIEPEESITEEYSEMPEPKPFRAIHAYEPQIDDELRLEVDNDIDVLYEYDDGWCWAINKTTGEQGACPLLCLISAREAVFGDHGWEKDMEIVEVPSRRESMLSFDSSNMSFSQMSLQRRQK